MDYEGELQLLCETFKKCRVPAEQLRPGDPITREINENFWLLFGRPPQNLVLSADHFQKIRPQTLYRMTTRFQFNYILFRLPRTAVERVLMIGPYLTEPLTGQRIMEIGEEYGIAPHRLKALEAYYGILPHIPDSSHLFTMLSIFCERIWGGSDAFSLEEIKESFLSDPKPLTAGQPGSDAKDLLLDMKLMEQRYSFENEMIRAVSLGQLHKVATIMNSFSTMHFEKRLDDPLRNLKNYSIIMNTLLRKAAENGGVHPIHIHEMSSGFAVKIENLSSVGEVQKLMTEMFRSYCLLVRKHSTQNLSTIVQKSILLIDADLSANLNLRTLAEAQNISAGYLSSLFKKETGRTVTAYINDRRMKLAAHLLSTTRLQIQTVALHCGILDVQYFSKVFKRFTGRTPKEYRAMAKREGSI